MANKSFVVFYGETFQPLYKYVVWRVGDKHISEDIVSEVFMKAYKSWDMVEIATAKAWIFRIARNTIVDYFRKHKQITSIDNLPNLKADDQLFDDALILEEEFVSIRSALSQLPEKQYTAIALKYFEGFKNIEIAYILGTSPKTVSSNIQEGLKKLKKIIA